jgi:hypothetical protein
MPSGFALPSHQVIRLRDGMVLSSLMHGGLAAMARRYGEATEHFKSQLKRGWSEHVDTGARAFYFTSRRRVAGTRGECTETQYRVQPLLVQSAPPASQFVQLTARHLDNLVRYLREARTQQTATTFGLTQVTGVPANACYSPQTIAIDHASDLFRVSFTTYSSRFGILAERYYFSVRTLGQTETIHGRQVPNLRPRLKVFWESELARHAVKARSVNCCWRVATPTTFKPSWLRQC